MKSKYPKIFEPITIKRMTIKNRVAMTPMGTNYGETSGEMSNRHMNYYSLRAKGGTGLIILENANIEYPVGSDISQPPFVTERILFPGQTAGGGRKLNIFI